MFRKLRTILAAGGSAALPPKPAVGTLVQAIPLRRLWWGAILLIALAATAVGWTILQLRADAIRTAISESGNIATVLANQLSRSLQAIDATLLDIRKSVQDRDIATPSRFADAFASRQFQQSLTDDRARLPQVFNLAIADRDGRIVASTASWPPPNVTIAERDYFQNARSRRDGQLSTSIPATNVINGKPTIIFARRIESADGDFAGVVFAGVNTEYFENIYGAIQSLQSVLFTLLRSDGIILFRYPDDVKSAGKPLSNKSGWIDALSKGDQGFRVLGQADGNIRYVSIRKVPGYPLIVDISVTESTALSQWWSRATAVGFGTSVFLLLSIYLLWAMTRQMRLLSESEVSLAQKSKDLEHMARYDALTGLANRTLFLEQASAALARMRRLGEQFSLLMLDLDRFKTVNDSLGHPAGDALLQEVARRLQASLRQTDCVARLGGDEFAILQIGGENPKGEAIRLSERILKAVTQPYDIDGRKLVVETSIGIAVAPQDGETAADLLKSADLALYKAKSEGRNRRCFFEASFEAEAGQRRELEDDMRTALSRNEFEVYYQTIVDVGRQECCGAEALVRWRHPKRGLMAPGQFIPLAEESGLIVPLGEWILRQACTDAVRWPPHIKLAVNLSPAQFKHGDLAAVLKAILGATGMPPHRLALEITETVLLAKSQQDLAVLHEIKSLGVSIVLDDFGIGYSSMTYLQMFPFDVIKIDQSFIQNMAHNESGAAIVCAVAGLGRSLDIATIAEGVETMEQLTFLRAAGCPFAQGYLFSRPVPVLQLSFEVPPLPRLDDQAA